MKIKKITPKVIYCHNQREFNYYMIPFAYPPDKSILMALDGVRCQCPSCGLLQVATRFDFEMNGGFGCQNCGSFTRANFIPDGATSYRLTPFEVRHIGKN